MITDEALRCYEAAGIEFATPEEFADRCNDFIQMGTVDGKPRAGSSSWQSIARGTGSIETDYLNGEIVLLGKLYGIPTPANRVIQQLANKLARERGRPGSYSREKIRSLIKSAAGETTSCPPADN
jgi:2-dehydropantoate 2-reductase